MKAGKRVAPGKLIHRRIPRSPDNTIDRPGIGKTATSYAIRPRRDERYPSWSTEPDPIKLLNIEARKGGDMSGWHVIALAVSHVEELGLRVVVDPTEEDPGHCLIVPTRDQAFTNKTWSRLAKRTRIVYTHGGR